MKTVYKVVRKTALPGVYCSAWMGTGSEQLPGVYYCPQKRAYPKIPNSYLFAFNSLKRAEWWVEKMSFGDNVEIWVANAGKAFETPFRRFNSTTRFLTVNESSYFWKNPSDRGRDGARVPDGSLCCTSIKLIERVSQ